MSFWEMGGYAVYVWPAFGATALILIGLLVISMRVLRARERALRALESVHGAKGPEGGGHGS